MEYKLSDLTKIYTGKLNANAATPNGKYPFFTCSKEISKINSYSYNCECILVAGNGDLNVKYFHGKFDAYQRTYIIENKRNDIMYMPYLYYFMSLYISKLRNQTSGGVIKYIKLNNLTDIIIELPEVDVQKEIVEKIKKVQKVRVNKGNKLVKFDTLIKARFVEMFGDPVINSKNLELSTLANLGMLGRGRSKHRPRNDPKLLGGKYPLIQTGEVSQSGLYIRNFSNTYSELGLKQSKLWPKDTLCITIAANIASTSILTFNACFPDSVVGFISNEDKVKPVFLHYWFSFFQNIIESQATQVAQKNINLKVLSNLSVIHPPISLQNEFADFVRQVDKSKFENIVYLNKTLSNKILSQIGDVIRD
ncbi:restriction endonuclease subunit S [Limosilactobacillus reuteri]|uniref:restriction endonuclease subunit S n=1 Tax=Limosilactobacillus reuteri TaxID=1598 RepID=UPI0021006D7D|nr:restriction endonuclease subunit S [Limosilactobacillus reuteri]